MSNSKKSMQPPKFKKPQFPPKGKPKAPSLTVTSLTGEEIDLYYMSGKEITVKELGEILTRECGQKVEIWDAMHIIEWITQAGHSIDIELAEPFTDEKDAAFLEANHVAAIYAIQALDTDIDLLKKCFRQVANRYGGFLCYDSEDFQPFIAL